MLWLSTLIFVAAYIMLYDLSLLTVGSRLFKICGLVVAFVTAELVLPLLFVQTQRLFFHSNLNNFQNRQRNFLRYSILGITGLTSIASIIIISLIKPDLPHDRQSLGCSRIPNIYEYIKLSDMAIRLLYKVHDS